MKKHKYQQPPPPAVPHNIHFSDPTPRTHSDQTEQGDSHIPPLGTGDLMKATITFPSLLQTSQILKEKGWDVMEVFGA